MTVVLHASQDAASNSIALTPERWPGLQGRLSAADGTHLVLREAGIVHRLWMKGPPETGASLAAEIPLDDTAASRLQATLRFWRHIATGRSRAEMPLPPQQRQQLIRKLRALDGRLSGASYREITEAFHGPLALTGDDWKTAPIRQATIRLVREGLSLMRGSYRRLLGARRTR